MSKLFTKSRFKIALDCPTKLYYVSNEEIYANAKLDDPFLKALAKGGFQVGALAQCYYPGGVEVKHKDYEKSLAETNELLKKENVVIFEAAIRFNNLFIRVDILEKKGNHINLIEVKSKSTDPNEFYDELWHKRELKAGIRRLKGDWQPYLYDVAFQAHVAKLANPSWKISSFLMCADTSKIATVNGLNQKFLLKGDGRDTHVEIMGDVSIEALGQEVLCRLDVSEVVQIIHDDLEMSERFNGRGFAGAIDYFAEQFQKNSKIAPEVSKDCKKCEFRWSEDGKKSGFNECWKACIGLSEEELLRPFAFDVWFFNPDDAFEDQNFLMEDLDRTYFEISSGSRGLSKGERQWLQVEKHQNNDNTPYVDVEGLRSEFSEFKYPLHMIDFETCMVAIPFNKDRRPYEQIAFQFSHHLIHENGQVEHADEFINIRSGEFPNFEFVRALKKALSKDEGTIFRYSNHENTVLCQIMEQLQVSNEVDKNELIEFILSITAKKKKNSKKGEDEYIWKGKRNMVDLLELVKGYYYSPAMGKSNSIKYVLPAILNESEFLKTKYSAPFYSSNNFKNHQWIKLDSSGKVIDPYKLLPQIMHSYDYEFLEETMSEGDAEIKDGGAALTAYALMQFTEMKELERTRIKEALLRYCELDTLAMVMIYEAWKDMITNNGKKSSSK
jgi:hypothetical protein